MTETLNEKEDIKFVSSEEHLLDLLAGWGNFVMTKGHTSKIEGGHQPFNFYQLAGSLMGEWENLTKEQRDIKVREFFDENIFPYIFKGETRVPHKFVLNTFYSDGGVYERKTFHTVEEAELFLETAHGYKNLVKKEEEGTIQFFDPNSEPNPWAQSYDTDELGCLVGKLKTKF